MFNNFTLQQFALLLELFVKRSDQTKLYIFSFEIMSSARGTETSYKKPKSSWVNPPTAVRQVTWNIRAHPGVHQRAYLILKGKMVCKLRVKRHLMKGCFYD